MLHKRASYVAHPSACAQRLPAMKHMATPSPHMQNALHPCPSHMPFTQSVTAPIPSSLSPLP